MYLKYVQIVNFKNLKNVRFEFSKGANTIIGENDSGKSNALTAPKRIVLLNANIAVGFVVEFRANLVSI